MCFRDVGVHCFVGSLVSVTANYTAFFLNIGVHQRDNLFFFCRANGSLFSEFLFLPAWYGKLHAFSAHSESCPRCEPSECSILVWFFGKASLALCSPSESVGRGACRSEPLRGLVAVSNRTAPLLEELGWGIAVAPGGWGASVCTPVRSQLPGVWDADYSRRDARASVY